MEIFNIISRILRSKSPTVSLVSYGCEDYNMLSHLLVSDKKLKINSISNTYRDTDILIINGRINKTNMTDIKQIFKEIPKNCIVIAYGSCSCSYSGEFKFNITIPGCPPSFKELSDTLIEAKKAIRTGKFE